MAKSFESRRKFLIRRWCAALIFAAAASSTFVWCIATLAAADAELGRFVKAATTQLSARTAFERAADQTPPSTAPLRNRDEIAADLKASPIFSVLARTDTAFFDALVDAAEAVRARGGDRTEIAAEVRSRYVDYILELVPFAPDDVLVDYLDLKIDEMKALQRRDPALCQGFLEGGYDPAIYDALDRGIVLREEALEARLMTTARYAYRLKASQAEMRVYWTALFESMAGKLDATDFALLAGPHAPQGREADAPRKCAAFIAVFEQIRETPQPQRNLLTRSVFADPAEDVRNQSM